MYVSIPAVFATWIRDSPGISHFLVSTDMSNLRRLDHNVFKSSKVMYSRDTSQQLSDVFSCVCETVFWSHRSSNKDVSWSPVYEPMLDLHLIRINV